MDYRIRIPQADYLNVLEGVNYLINHTRLANGWISSNSFVRQGELVTILLIEEWATMALLKNHLRSQIFKKVLEIMDMSVDEPEIRIFEYNSVKGLPWVKKLLMENYKQLKENEE